MMKKLLLLLILSFSSLSGGEFYGLFIGDTESFDIGDEVYMDLFWIKKELIEIGEDLDRPLNILDDQEIDHLECHSDDILFFYYSGHEEQLDRDLFDTVMKLHPQLLIVVIDCCNSPTDIEGINLPQYEETEQFYDSELIKENTRQLFLHQTGVILAYSASPGEASWTSVLRGSEYTYALTQELRHELQTPNPSWERIFEKVASRLEGMQHPVYRISN